MVGERTVKSRTTVKVRLLARVLILVLSVAFVFLSLGPGRLYPRDVSVRQLHEHPSYYVGQRVKVIGYLVKHTALRFGDTYTLCEGDPRNLYLAENPCVAVAGTSETIDLFLSLLYDGTIYKVAASPCSFTVPCRVAVSGFFTDRGPVIDASQYIIEDSSVAWHE